MDLDRHCIRQICKNHPSLHTGFFRERQCYATELARQREEGITIGMCCGCPVCDPHTSFWKKVRDLKKNIEEDSALLAMFKRASSSLPVSPESTCTSNESCSRPPRRRNTARGRTRPQAQRSCAGGQSGSDGKPPRPPRQRSR